jgi:outer membrane protein OmpA-like peptidoglycan-associated protein
MRLLCAVVFLAACSRTAVAQERRYLFEVGAGGVYQSFADVTDLGGAAGGFIRGGIWLPLNLSVEAEGLIASSDPGVQAGSVSLLYNFLLGPRTWGYAKAGIGGTRYGGSGDECLEDPDFQGEICGTTTTFGLGLGTRFQVSPMLMLRAEAMVNPNKGRSREGEDISFSNYGLNVGVSVMLGSKPIPDSDDDGILNNRDRCPNTPAGAQVNDLGCPADNDGDGVANGIDRCSNTPLGAIVDAIGCTRDSDSDNIPDGIDKCPDSPEGVLVDSVGCPRDSDADGIADGLDRCSATPKGAVVDALGCPGDEDADGVLDGLDRCPRTAFGAAVNSRGCPTGQQGRQQAPPPAEPVTPPAETPPPPAATPPAPSGGPVVLEGVNFESGSARLNQGSYVELDSLAKVLLANPRLRIEIGGHTDNAGTPASNQHLSTLRAEAVRNYLVAKGVPYQQMVARGYGSTIPRTPDTTPQGLAANRRVEIRPLPPEP